uniref:Uncharacterized protein n=1 Tax=Arundo donax TaxID=35708 RepID=A0A0A9GUQ4_ARUDO
MWLTGGTKLRSCSFVLSIT